MKRDLIVFHQSNEFFNVHIYVYISQIFRIIFLNEYILVPRFSTIIFNYIITFIKERNVFIYIYIVAHFSTTIFNYTFDDGKIYLFIWLFIF